MPRNIPRIKKPRVLEWGHRVYDLTRNARTTTAMASRLVLLAFVGPPPAPDLEASHLNGDSSDNYVDNLAWETHIENEQQKIAHGTFIQGEKSPHAKLTESKVIEFRRRLNNGEKLTALQKESGISWAAFCHAMYGTNWKRLNSIAPPAIPYSRATRSI